jgi:hypothetical protein
LRIVEAVVKKNLPPGVNGHWTWRLEIRQIT